MVGYICLNGMSSKSNEDEDEDVSDDMEGVESDSTTIILSE